MRRAIGAPGPLLLLFLVLGALTVATLHRQEVETAAGAARPSGATATWLSVLAVPVVVVTLVGLAVAAAVRSGGPRDRPGHHVGRRPRRRGAGRGRTLGLAPGGRAATRTPAAASSTSPPAVPRPRPPPRSSRLRLVVIGAAVAVQHLAAPPPGRPAGPLGPELAEHRAPGGRAGGPRAADVEPPPGVARRWAGRLWARLRRRHPGPAGAEPLAAPGPSEDPGPVRRSYRELLTTLAGRAKAGCRPRPSASSTGASPGPSPRPDRRSRLSPRSTRRPATRPGPSPPMPHCGPRRRPARWSPCSPRRPRTGHVPRCAPPRPSGPWGRRWS